MRINGVGFPCSCIYAPSVRDTSTFDIAGCPIRRPGFVDRVDLGIQVCPRMPGLGVILWHLGHPDLADE
jgi:hypothetical protein